MRVFTRWLFGVALTLVLTACPGAADTLDPEVTITSPAADATLTTAAVTVQGTVRDNVGVTRLTYQVDGGAEQETANVTPALPAQEASFSFQVTLQEGQRIIAVNAYDAAGNSSQDVVTVTVDTTAPTVTITSPEDGATVTTPAVTVTGTASNGSTVTRVTYSLGDGAEQEVAITPAETVEFSFEATLQEGANTITVNAYDAAGNSGQGSVTVTVAPPPAVTITNLEDGAVVATPTVTVEGEAEHSTEISRVTYRLNGGAEQEVAITPGPSVTFAFDVSLISGSHVLTVNAYSAADTGGSTSIDLSYDPLAAGEIGGHVFVNPSAGGAPLEGAEISVTVGGETQTAVTSADGSYSASVNLAAGATTFSLTVVPPPGLDLVPVTYFELPLEAYASPYGAAGELNIYLTGGEPVQLEASFPHLGCFTGALTGLDGEPVLGTNPRERPLATACDLDELSDELLGSLGATPLPGEDGIVSYNFRTVVTDEDGNYLLPFRTGSNLRAVSGWLWAGNYTGTDTGDPQTSLEFFWEDYAFIPNTNLFLTPDAPFPNQSLDLSLAPFDPAANPEVTTLQVSHDTSALADFIFIGPVFNAFSFSTPYLLSNFLPVELGQYYFFATGPRNLRVPVIPSGVQAAQIRVDSVALTVDQDFNPAGLSVSQNWRDGTNLTTPLTAEFLGIPVLGPIADPGLSPTLTWSAVEDATIYYVQIADPATGAPVWEGITTQTAISLPLELEAGTIYLWLVVAYDSLEPIDILSLDPLALHASRWFDSGHYAKLQDLKSDPVNSWRGRLAEAFLTNQGHIPRTLPGPRAGFQDLLTTGFRFSQSQVTPFTTGD